jgi:hypothetical protein
MSKLVGGVVIIAALGSMMTATAFKTAAVTNNMTITVAATNTAALAMDASATPDNGVATTVVSGQLQITVNDKLQPGSTYCFSPAFKVTNTGASAPTFTFTAPTVTGMPGTATLTLFKSGGSPCSTSLTGQTLAGNGSTDVDMQIVIPSGTALATSNPTIVINGNH